MTSASKPSSAPLSAPSQVKFDWTIYRSATLAGLAVLIPIPLIDWLFEELFRRGMPATIAKRRGRQLAPGVVAALNRGTDDFWATCLTLPIRLVIELIKRLSRKLLYFLTVKEASDKIALYWHQAFLIDHMLQRDHLQSEASAWIARQAMDQVIRSTSTSPLSRLASDVTSGTRHIFRSLVRARRGVEDEVIAQKKRKLVRGWSDFGFELQTLAAAYDRVYYQILTTPKPPPTTPPRLS